jgi:hypothetical protein
MGAHRSRFTSRYVEPSLEAGCFPLLGRSGVQTKLFPTTERARTLTATTLHVRAFPATERSCARCPAAPRVPITWSSRA